MPETPLVSVIDDSHAVRGAVANVVRSAGFAVESFASVEEFICSNHMPNTACLVVNVQLPGMSGLQLRGHLASAGRHIPMVFTIGAHADQRARTRALELRAVRFQDQPSGSKALLKEICSILKPKRKEE